MSTNYYKFKDPITLVKKEIVGKHAKLTVFINHQNSGTLVVNKDQGDEIFEMFVAENIVLHTWYGGKERGKMAKFFVPLKPEDHVVSGCFSVTVAEVVADATVTTEDK